MLSQSKTLITSSCLLAFATVLVPSASLSQNAKVRYLNYSESQDTIRLFAGSALPGTEIADATTWDTWIRQQDKQVCERINRAFEDSVSIALRNFSFQPGSNPQHAAATPSDERRIWRDIRLRLNDPPPTAGVPRPVKDTGER
jgi:hypothetical protein